MTSDFGLSRATVESIKSILSKYSGIEKVVLYGSRAKGNYKLNSDIDLVLIAPSLSLSELLKIENQIDDLLLPYKVDLSLLHKIDNEELIAHINRVGQEFL